MKWRCLIFNKIATFKCVTCVHVCVRKCLFFVYLFVLVRVIFFAYVKGYGNFKYIYVYAITCF